MKKLLVVLMLGAAMSAAPTAAFAGCFEDLGDCYNEAAKIDSWVSRWLAGLDCELDFIECTRIKLVGT